MIKFIKNLFEYKKPIIKENTFIVWEPCSKSHAEVVPGYCKYLLDLGYHVSVLVEPDRLKEGLFCRFQDENLSVNVMKKKDVEKYFKNDSLENVSGVLVTTVGKICNSVEFDTARKFFSNVDSKKLFFVEHEAKHAVDNGSWEESLITLRQLNYRGASSTIVNPHYFGKVEEREKNRITNFVVVGKFTPGKKDTHLIVDTALELIKNYITDFKITVIGHGDLTGFPPELKKYIDIKGRLSFEDMYREMENADFMLTAYDDKKEEHLGYITSSTSGCFQLAYGFLKPCVIIKSFAPIHGFTAENSIVYPNNESFYQALVKGIEMTNDEYKQMQKNLKTFVDGYYKSSLNNLKNLIETQQGK